MRAKIIAFVMLLFTSQVGQALACTVCFSGRNSRSSESIAVAIWFLMAALMAVLGGVGAFGFQIWRHSRMPLEPHQELAEEDLKQYE